MQQHCFIHDTVTVDVLVDNLINDDDYNNNEDDKHRRLATQASCERPSTLRTMRMTSSKCVLQQRHLLG